MDELKRSFEEFVDIMRQFVGIFNGFWWQWAIVFAVLIGGYIVCIRTLTRLNREARKTKRGQYQAEAKLDESTIRHSFGIVTGLYHYRVPDTDQNGVIDETVYSVSHCDAKELPDTITVCWKRKDRPYEAWVQGTKGLETWAVVLLCVLPIILMIIVALIVHLICPEFPG